MVASTSKSPDTEINTDAPLTERSVAAAHEAIDNLSARMARTEKSVRDMVSGLGLTCTVIVEELIPLLDHSVAPARHSVAGYEFMAAGIAFRAGAVVLALLRR